jgi:O-antigen/teichoic acid export membrane protein
MARILRVGAIWVVCVVLNAEQVGVLVGLEDFKRIAQLNVIRGTLVLIGGGIGALSGGLIGTVIGFSGASCLLCVITAKQVRDSCGRMGIRPVYLSAHHDMAMLTKFAIPSTLAGLLALPVNWLGPIILVNRPGGFTEMGLFNAATHWRAAVCFPSSGFSQICLPLLAGYAGKRDKAAYRKGLIVAIAAMMIPTLGIAAVLRAGTGTLVRLYGHGFLSARPVFFIVIITAVASTLDATLGMVLSSQGKMWPLMWLTTLWAALTIGFCCWLIPEFKAVGLAAALLGAYALEVPVRGWQARRTLSAASTTDALRWSQI